MPFHRLRAAGLSVALIAQEMRVTRVTVHYWLTGRSTPPPSAILLAELLWGGDTAGDWPAAPGELRDLSG
jgi:hypothetical protein